MEASLEELNRFMHPKRQVGLDRKDFSKHVINATFFNIMFGSGFRKDNCVGRHFK